MRGSDRGLSITILSRGCLEGRKKLIEIHEHDLHINCLTVSDLIGAHADLDLLYALIRLSTVC